MSRQDIPPYLVRELREVFRGMDEARMIRREVTPHLLRLFTQYPFVTVHGPRQSGKSTLCRATFPHLEYVNLEAPNQRELASSDPQGFLARLGEGAILDEIQRVPELLSWLQVLADEERRNGLFILSGSEQFPLSDAISQSLAGRTALLRLLPLSLGERQKTGAGDDIDDILCSGFYPRLYDPRLKAVEPAQVLSDYIETYIERDVRQVAEIRNLSTFRRFLRLCAGRIGQLVNFSALGADAGVSHTTASHWLTILETSHIVFLLPPFHTNIRKRLVKSPKIYFHDVGLASHLIGVENAAQMATHPLRGPLFENMVIAETLKHYFNQSRRPRLYFFRDAQGLECDLICEGGDGLLIIEIKSGATIASDWFKPLDRVAGILPRVIAKAIIYGGCAWGSGEVLPVAGLAELLK